MSRRSSALRHRTLARVGALAPVALIAAVSGLAAQEAIALAVAPLPESEQAGASVIQNQGGDWVTLREGSGAFICIADDPSDERFHSSCYHESLDAYMSRGRELRAEGVEGGDNVQRRIAEIEAGTLEMPSYAFLHSIFAPNGWSGDMDAVQAHFAVIYTPFAKAEDVGLPTSRVSGPWMMASGAANAHIMITP